MDFEIFEHQSVVKFLTKLGTAPTDIHKRMVNVYGDRAPSKSTIEKWAAEFKLGQTWIVDDPHTSRPVKATTPANSYNFW